MRNYELLFILKPEMEEEKIQAALDKYTAIITDGQGEVANVDKWGKRRLAYEIQDFQDGFYILVTFKSEPAVVKELDRVLKIQDDVLRFMIVNIDEK